MEEKVEKSFRIDLDVFRRFRAALVLNGKDSDKDADDVVEKLLDGYFKEAIGEHVPAQQSNGFEGFDLDRPQSTSFLSIRAARAYTMPDALTSEEDAETDEQKERERTERKIRRWAEKRDSVPYFILRSFLCVCSVESREEKQKVEDVFVVECQKVQNGGTDEELLRAADGVRPAGSGGSGGGEREGGEEEDRFHGRMVWMVEMVQARRQAAVRCGGWAMESRGTSETGTASWRGADPATRRSERSASARRPISAKSWRTVVSAGESSAACRASSIPVTRISSGTDTPSLPSVLRSRAASMSLPQAMASTRKARMARTIPFSSSGRQGITFRSVLHPNPASATAMDNPWRRSLTLGAQSSCIRNAIFFAPRATR